MSPFPTIPDRTWNYTPPTSGGLTSTTPATVISPTTGNRCYITDIACWNYVVSGSTVVEVTSSGSVLFRAEVGQYVPGATMNFRTPLRGAVGQPILIQLLSGGQKVWASLSGFFDSQ